MEILTKELDQLKNELGNKIKETEELHNSYYEQFKTFYLYSEIKPKSVFKYSHQLCQELLNFIVNVCKKYKLNYWLDYGTLLGAVRHQVYIPWDDDIDIGMMRTDFDKLYVVLQEEIERNNLSEFITVNLDRLNSRTNPITFIQVFITPNYHAFFAGVDVFPYDYMSDKNSCNEKVFRKEKSVFVKNLKNGESRKECMDEVHQRLNLTYDSNKYIILGIDNARGGFKGYKYVVLRKETLFPLNKIKFDGTEYSCPNNYDLWLKSIYGNYYELPKLIHHHHVRIDHLNRKKGAIKTFQEYISKLSIVNENFE